MTGKREKALDSLVSSQISALGISCEGLKTYIIHFRTATFPFIKPLNERVTIIMVRDLLKPNMIADIADPIDPWSQRHQVWTHDNEDGLPPPSIRQ